MNEPELQPIPQPVFPCKDSLQDAVDYIKGQLPITDSNTLYALLMLYHNTLLQAVETINKGK